MDPKVAKRLKNIQTDPSLHRLSTKCTDFVKTSLSWMRDYHTVWTSNYKAYRSEQEVYAAAKTAKKGEPTKVPMPALLAQVETITTFFAELLTQEEVFFQVVATGPEDVEGAKLAGPLLEKDLERVGFRELLLPAALRDIVLTNVCGLYTTWQEESHKEVVVEPVIDPQTGAQIGANEVEKVVIDDQYNAVRLISPFHLLPDPRLPLYRYQEGEFCGIEDVYTKQQVAEFDRRGITVGAQEASQRSYAITERRKFDVQNTAHDVAGGDNAVILTELQVKLIPKDYGLGDSEKKELWLVWLIGDKIVRLEAMGYEHSQFTILIGCGKLMSDVYVADSISEAVVPMQNTINFLLNGRVANLRQNIRNKWVVDQSAVELADIDDVSKPYIRLKAIASGVGVDQWIKQVSVADVSGSIVNDINSLDTWMKTVTGATDTLLGMISTGRRSATEMKAAVSSATSRLKTCCHAVWRSALLPLGKQMLSNYRQGLSMETVVRVFGDDQDAVLSAPNFVGVQRESLPNNYDFRLLSTLSNSEKLLMAQQLKELLQLVLTQPMLMQQFNINIQKILVDLLKLQGLRHAAQYIQPLTPATPGVAAPVGGVAQQPGNQTFGGAPVDPTFASVSPGGNQVG